MSMQTWTHLLTRQLVAVIQNFVKTKTVKSFLLFLFVVFVMESWAEIILHRAVEPERMGLEINISGKSLALHIALKEESLSVFKKKMSVEHLHGQLERLPYFALPEDAARCRVTGKEMNQSVDQITGYQIFHCERPEQLKSIEVKLYDSLPSLKAVDVYLTTDKWQGKTVVYPDDLRVIIKSGILK